jgi:hypothetical protein
MHLVAIVRGHTSYRQILAAQRWSAELPFQQRHASLEDQMNESKKLIALRSKLVGRRRAIVASFQTVSSELLTGDVIARIQSAIDAVDRAIVEERRAESNVDESPRLVPSSSQRP